MKIITTLIVLILSAGQLIAQESDNNKQTLKVKLKEAKNLVVYIDGKQYDSDILDILDTDKIESVSVFKGQEAKKKYNAPEGVVVITTKKQADKLEVKSDSEYPMVILDGEISSREEIAKLDPSQIDSIEVIKGEKAIEQYKALNGVIVIKTKKQ